MNVKADVCDLKKSSCIILFVILIMISINSSILVYGYSFDTILICDEVDTSTKKPIGAGDIHLTYSGYIYCWINLTNVVKPLSIKFDWFQPDEELYRSSTIYTYSGSFPLLSVYDLMKVAYYEPASNPGNWSVEVYVNDVFIAATKFILIDYRTIIDKVENLETNVEDLETNVEDLTIAYDDLISQHISLKSNYDDLFDNYENITYFYNIMHEDYDEAMCQKINLESQYDYLVSDYDELVKLHNDLLDERDELISDYDSIVKNLNDTRNTMYGAIFGMIILLAIAVYLFTH